VRLRVRPAQVVGGEVSDCSDWGVCIRGPDNVQQRCTGVKLIGVTGALRGRALLTGCARAPRRRSGALIKHQRPRPGAAGIRNGRGGLLVGRSTHCLTVTGGCDWGGSARGSGILVTNEGAGPAPSDIIISNNHCYNNALDGITIEAGSNVVCQVSDGGRGTAAVSGQAAPCRDRAAADAGAAAA
jgi:hypothetical protein